MLQMVSAGLIKSNSEKEAAKRAAEAVGRP
jgi:hypothetical protein